LRSAATRNLAVQSHRSLDRQWHELAQYWARKRELFIIQVLLFIAFVDGLISAHRKLSQLTRAQPGLAQTARTLGAPIPSALVLALLLSPWLYPQPHGCCGPSWAHSFWLPY
jgi:hypothetical protein